MPLSFDDVTKFCAEELGVRNTFTTPFYWDCECPKDYIHPKGTVFQCSVCGAIQADQPDSRLNEVLDMVERGNIPDPDGVYHLPEGY